MHYIQKSTINLKSIYRWATATRLRKILSSTLAILILLTSIRYIFLKPKEVYADSLLGFNEGYGTTISDNNGNVSGTISGAAWRTSDLCKFDKCLQFDGSNDLINFGNDSDVNFTTGSFTIEGWFRAPDSATTRIIAAKHNATAGGYKVYLDTNGYVIFGIDDDSAWTPDNSASTSTKAFDDNSWHHFAAVKNGTTSISIYVDGNLYQTTTSIVTGSLSNANNFYIGIDGNGTSNPFLGALDEMKVYSTSARTQDEIESDFTGTTASRGTSVSFEPDNSYISNGLTGYWKLDESSGNASDASGNGLTLTNNGTTTFVSGKYGFGSEHVPASVQHFSTATTINGVKSVSFWVNPDITTNYYVSLTSGAYITSSSGTISATGFSNPKIYVNGIESQTISANSWQYVTVSADSAINANLFYIGRQGSNYFDGTLDEVRLYNRTLSDQEARKLFDWAPGPVAYWKIDENSGTTNTFDTSGNGFSGTLTSITQNSWAPGKFGSALNLDGSADFIDIGAGPSTVNSVSFWVKPSTTSEHFIDLNGSAYISASAGTLSATGFSSPTYYINGIQTASPTITANVWQHIAVTTSTSINASDLDIGRLEATDFLAGTIDDVRIYNYARRASQIIEDMNAGHSAPGSPVGSAVAYWKFDEGHSTTAYDTNNSTGGTENLTLSLASWTANGKIGKAWNGADNLRASIADDQDLDPPSDFSISIWFKSDGAAAAATEYLVSKMSASAGYQMYFNTSEQLVCGIDDDATSFPEDSATTSSVVYDTTWHHAVCVRDITQDKLYLYIDGKLAASDTDLSATGSLDNAATFYIGDQNATNGTDEFLGDVDEVKFFSFALTPSEIQVEYNQASSALLGATSTDSSGNPTWSSQREYCPPGDTRATCGPTKLEWLLDENTGIENYDTSGSGATGSWTTGTPVWAPGISGSALHFSNDVVKVTPTSWDGTATGWTVSLWAKADTTSQGQFSSIFASSDAGGADTFQIDFGGASGCSGMYRVYGDDSTGVTNFAVCFDTLTSEWVHLVVTLNTSSTVTTYMNGVLKNQSTIANGFDGLFTRYKLGVNRSAGSFFDGVIDQVRIFEYPMTAAEVAWDYNHGKPSGHWKMDENSGTTTNDSSPHSNDSSVFAGNTTWTTGKFNTALTFDGTDDNVRIVEGTGIDFGSTTDPYTISAWFKTTTNFAGNAAIVAKNDGSGAYPFFLYLNSSEQACFQISDNTNSPSTCSSNALNDGNWHNIVGRRSITGDAITLFVDGNQANSTTDTTTTTTANNDDVSFANAGTSYLGNDFNGQIDEVNIFNYDLSSQQIKLIYDESATTRFGTQ